VELWQAFRASFALLDRRGRQVFLLAGVLQASLSILDVIGVIIIGVLATIASRSLFQTSQPIQIDRMLELFNLTNLESGRVVLLLTLCALCFFLGKTVLALYFTHKSFRFLAGQQSRIGNKLVSKVLNSDYNWFRNQDPHVLSQSLVRGVSAATVIQLGNGLLLIGEITLVFMFLVFLIVFSPLIAILLFLYVFIVLYSLNIMVGKRITKYHDNLTNLDLESQVSLFNALKLFREMRVLQRSDWFQENSSKIVNDQALNFADDAWIQQLPKYVLEVAMLIGAFFVLSAGSLFSNSGQIVTTFAVYLAGTARIFPSLLRMQASFISLRSHSALTLNTHNLFHSLSVSQNQKGGSDESEDAELNLTEKFTGVPAEKCKDSKHDSSIKLTNLEFVFPNSDRRVLNDLSFEISPGERVAIVGPSGAGKSTLCDLFLGLLYPTNGSISIGGVTSQSWIKSHTGMVAYLPQETALVNGSILDNICAGLHAEEIDLNKVALAIEKAQLKDFINDLPEGIYTQVGIGGAKLSGGQKQRIGIARALYSDPLVVIMDEATSALDAETEDELMSVLSGIGPQKTVIFIAHRLSSIRNFHRVMYFEDGRLLGDGTFSQLRIEVPRFEKQARLLGL
jgi:ATP-binding cassette, subfamily B, bacterial PglK